MLNRFVNLQSRRFVFFPNQRNLSGELFKTNRDQSYGDSLDREALVSFHLGGKASKNINNDIELEFCCCGKEAH